LKINSNAVLQYNGKYIHNLYDDVKSYDTKYYYKIISDYGVTG